MSSPTTTNSAATNHQLEHAGAASGPRRFLNNPAAHYKLRLAVRRELGILARVALVFSRRGLDIAALALTAGADDGSAVIKLSYFADGAQHRSVLGDLRRLVDVTAVRDRCLPLDTLKSAGYKRREAARRAPALQAGSTAPEHLHSPKL